MIYNQLLLLCLKSKGNDLFYSSQRLLGRGFFGYQVLGAGKNRTEYLKKDLLALLVPDLNEEELEQQKKKKEHFDLCLNINDKKIFSSIKNIYLPGLHVYENFSHMKSSYNYFFTTFRIYAFYLYYFLFATYVLFQIFFLRSLFFKNDFMFFNFFFLGRKKLINSYLIKGRTNRFKGRSRSLSLLKTKRLIKHFLRRLHYKKVKLEIKIIKNYKYLTYRRGRKLTKLYNRLRGISLSETLYFSRKNFFQRKSFKLYAKIRLLRRKRKRMLVKRLRFFFKFRRLVISRISRKKGPYKFQKIFSYFGFAQMFTNLRLRFRRNLFRLKKRIFVSRAELRIVILRVLDFSSRMKKISNSALISLQLKQSKSIFDTLRYRNVFNIFSLFFKSLRIKLQNTCKFECLVYSAFYFTNVPIFMKNGLFFLESEIRVNLIKFVRFLLKMLVKKFNKNGIFLLNFISLHGIVYRFLDNILFMYLIKFCQLFCLRFLYKSIYYMYIRENLYMLYLQNLLD